MKSTDIISYPVYVKVPNPESRVDEFNDADTAAAFKKAAAMTAQKNKRMIPATLRAKFITPVG